MSSFNPDDYGETLAPLLQPRLMALDPGSPNLAMRPHLESLSDLDFFGKPIKDRDMARACVAGLWLYHDFLDESHAISQELHTPEGSYWHAIMHRREPDASNAAYWFRRVGDHPAFETLGREAQGLGLRLQTDRWNPFDFIDLCEQHRGAGTEREMLLRKVQQREWELLFDWCFHRAARKE
jgi:hypothetical protein